MIYERTPLTLGEVKEKLKDIPDSDNKTETEIFLKKFSKLSVEKSSKMKKELESLEILKLKREHIIKIVDLVPEDNSDLNKIVSDVSLTEDEANKILGVVKSNK